MARKVLVVDDEPGICDLVCLNLESEGYEVTCANSGHEAMEKIKREHPDLIVLDIMMPEIDGWEVLSHLKADPATSGIPVILLSAKSEEVSKLLGFKLGADDYVTKPFSVKELTARIGIAITRDRENHKAAAGPEQRIAAYRDNELYFLNPEDILFAVADRNYTYLCTGGERFVIRRNLSAVEQKLPENFNRIHKSYIVNIDRISKLFSPARGRYLVELDDPDSSRIPVSRGKAAALRQRLKQ